MLKRAAIWFSAIVLSSCCVMTQCKIHQAQPQPLRSTTPEQVLDRTVALVHFVNKSGDEVSLESKTEKLISPYCSGVWISDDVIVTAAHCVDDLGKPTPEDALLQALICTLQGGPLPNPDAAWDPTGQSAYYSIMSDVRDKRYRNATVIAFDKEHDLALIRATNSSISPLPEHLTTKIANDVHIGDDVHIVGHPIGKWWTYIKGTVSAIHFETNGPDEQVLDAIQISAPIWVGNSGGGAFNSDGELVGICSWISRGPNISFFIHYDQIVTLLKRNNVTHL